MLSRGTGKRARSWSRLGNRPVLASLGRGPDARMRLRRDSEAASAIFASGRHHWQAAPPGPPPATARPGAMRRLFLGGWRTAACQW